MIAPRILAKMGGSAQTCLGGSRAVVSLGTLAKGNDC